MKRKDDIIFDTINYILLLIVTFLTIYPFYYILVISFNDGLDASRGGIYFWPRLFSLDNYKKLIFDIKWLNSFKVSVIRTVLGTVFTVAFTSVVAYGMSNKKLLFRKAYHTVLIFSMYFSGGLIPYYILLKKLGMLNSMSVYIIPSLLSPFLVLIMVSFFQDVPEALSEAAKIDGASDLKIFVRIILPISTPVLATAALFTAVGQWNSWIDSAYFVTEPKLRTMSYHLMEIINKSLALNSGEGNQAAYLQSLSVTTKSLQSAAIIIATVPILTVYPFLQKYFVKGIMLGSVKE